MLGARPILVGAAGEDFSDYRSWLSRHGVVTDHVHISQSRHTARFVCTTDDTMAQIATFYAGAMAEARMIELGPIHDPVGPRPRAHRRRRPRGDAAPHRGVPQPRHPVHRRPLAAAGVRRRPVHPQADRRRRLPVHQRVRVAPHRDQDRMEPGRDRRPGHHPGHHPRQGRRRHPHQGRRTRSTCRSPATSSGSTPPGSATRSAPASSSAWPAGWATSGAPRSARCSRPTCCETDGAQEYVVTRSGFVDHVADGLRRRRRRGDRAARAVRPRLTVALDTAMVHPPVEPPEHPLAARHRPRRPR